MRCAQGCVSATAARVSVVPTVAPDLGPGWTPFLLLDLSEAVPAPPWALGPMDIVLLGS